MHRPKQAAMLKALNCSPVSGSKESATRQRERGRTSFHSIHSPTKGYEEDKEEAWKRFSSREISKGVNHRLDIIH